MSTLTEKKKEAYIVAQSLSKKQFDELWENLPSTIKDKFEGKELGSVILALNTVLSS